MWLHLYDWISLFIKWFHVISGIAWIGASFYFTWLDSSLETPPRRRQNKGIQGQLWAVHGDGFYEVLKYRYGPEKVPHRLHWFTWEAYTTWLTGTALLIWIYYFNASAYLIDPHVIALSPWQAATLGITGILLGVLSYELLLRSPASHSVLLLVLILILLGALFFYGLTALFSARGAFIHMGAIIGSIMVSNVMFSIIPGQRKMVAQVSAGLPVDPLPGQEGKRRSVHNNYFTLPVVFLMISNHYPIIYQHHLSWLIGLVILVISAWVRHAFNLRHAGRPYLAVLLTGIVAMSALAVALSLPGERRTSLSSVPVEPANSQQTAMNIIQTRCVSCYSAAPTDDVFTVAPNGVILDCKLAVNTLLQ